MREWMLQKASEDKEKTDEDSLSWRTYEVWKEYFEKNWWTERDLTERFGVQVPKQERKKKRLRPLYQGLGIKYNFKVASNAEAT